MRPSLTQYLLAGAKMGADGGFRPRPGGYCSLIFFIWVGEVVSSDWRAVWSLEDRDTL